MKGLARVANNPSGNVFLNGSEVGLLFKGLKDDCYRLQIKRRYGSSWGWTYFLTKKTNLNDAVNWLKENSISIQLKINVYEG